VGALWRGFKVSGVRFLVAKACVGGVHRVSIIIEREPETLPI